MLWELTPTVSQRAIESTRRTARHIADIFGAYQHSQESSRNCELERLQGLPEQETLISGEGFNGL